MTVRLSHVYCRYDGDDDGLLSRDELRDALFPDDRPDPVPTGKPNPPKLQTMHKQSAAVSPVPTPQPPGNGEQRFWLRTTLLLSVSRLLSWAFVVNLRAILD